MKLSMAILADKLKAYSPELNRTDAPMDLTGARMLTAERMRSDILYVVPAGETLGDSTAEKTVTCIHGESRMRLHTDDPAEVLDALLDIFEAFGKWEGELREAATHGREMQHFIDVSRYALPFPMYITDLFGSIVGYSREYHAGSVDESWDRMLARAQSGEREATELSAPGEGEELPPAHGELRGRLKLHLMQGSEYVGTITIIGRDGTYLSEGTYQLADLFRNAASEALAVRGTDAEMRTVVSLVRDYLDGKNVDTERMWPRICKAAEYTGGDMELILIEGLDHADPPFKRGLAQNLAGSGVPCFCLPYHDRIAAILSCGNEAEFLSKVKGVLSGYLYTCGVSLPFSAEEKLRNAVVQANLALSSGGREAGKVNRCVDHVYDYLLDRLASENGIASDLVHPALELLRKYDRQHQTELYRTLYEYLLQERNAVAAAKHLFIHRNSMLYRLQRIDQLLGLDLDNVKLRMYLLLSYHIEEARSRAARERTPGKSPDENRAETQK